MIFGTACMIQYFQTRGSMSKDFRSLPRICLWTLNIFVDENKAGMLEANFEEIFNRIYIQKGVIAAHIWFWGHFLKSLPAIVIRSIYWSFIMLYNYLKTTLRNIRIYKIYSLINISGLAIGTACSILIMLYVLDELSFDTFHEKADRIFRIEAKGQIGNTDITGSNSSAILNRTLREEYPEIITATSIAFRSNYLVRYEDRIFKENRIILTDTTFFDVFTFPLTQGDKKRVLAEPNSVVITETTSEKYFSNEDPVGKTLVIDDTGFTVTGVVKDVPTNSHIQFDFLISLESFQDFYYETGFTHNSFLTYLMLRDGILPEQMNAKFPDIVKKHIYDDNPDAWSGDNYYMYFLKPLGDIYLNNSQTVYIFMVIAVFILLIACINFMNLTTAISANRAKEIGIRKVIGSFRSQLIRQFMSESVFLSMISLFLAIILVEISLPAYRSFLGKELSIPYNDPYVVACLAGLALSVGLFSGIYPAFFLSSFRPAAVLKGRLKGGSKNSVFRNGLVIFQFSISIFLIICTFVVFRQLELFQNKKLGFDKDQVLVIRNPAFLGDKAEIFTETLLQRSEISNVALSNTLPGRGHNNWGVRPEGKNNTTLDVCLTDDGFLETMKLELVSGRNFSREIQSDETAILLNEKAARLLNYNDGPVGKTLESFMRKFTVIGVIKDYNYRSLRQEIRPMMLMNLSSGFREARYITARITTEDLSETLSFIENSWNSFTSNIPYEFSFLDEDYNSIYRSEKQIGEILTFFSFIAVFIASLGLFGLALFMAKQRTKEIGIRKVLGASERNIMRLLSQEFLIMVVISNIISWPLAWYAMNWWLGDFAYRIDIGFDIFLLSSFIAVLFAIVALSYQSIKTLRTDPVNSLRCE